jgi:hypothetical protein
MPLYRAGQVYSKLHTVINQEKIKYYIGIVSDTAYEISKSNDDIRIDDGLDWLNESYDRLVEKHREKEMEIVMRRTTQTAKARTTTKPN